MARLLFVLLGGFVLSFASVQARPVFMESPEQMETESSVVCTGMVLSVDKTGVQRDISYPDVSPPFFHMAQMKARVKVLHLFKGQAPAEFDLIFEVLDPAKYPQMAPNDLERIYVQKGERYRFFLKPGDGETKFRGVLDGTIDDGFSVQGLWPHEADDAPYLKQAEAVQIARDYLAAQTKGDKAEGPVTAYCNPNAGGGSAWSVILQKGPSARSPYCAICVHGDRTVDPKFFKLWDTPR